MRKLHVVGATGRLGSAIVTLARSEKEWIVTGSSSKDCLTETLSEADVIIDVSSPAGSARCAQICEKIGVALVIGTTGLGAAELAAIRECSGSCPVLVSANFSITVNLLFWLTRQTAERLDSSYDAEIIESHHRLKKDAPSGTAYHLAGIVAQQRQMEVPESVKLGRSGLSGPRANSEIGIHAVRGGDIVGEHTVIFAGTGERLELTQRTSHRAPYAAGALRAASWIAEKTPGWYTMDNVLGFSP